MTRTEIASGQRSSVELAHPGPARADEDDEGFAGRVLLVDDHPVNQRLAKVFLEALGWPADVVENGEDAVKAAAAGAYFAILMDLHMPGMDGLEAARAIRRLRPPQGLVPIIAMSADALPRTLQRCREAGMDDHIPKPIELAVMHRVLQRWLNGQSPAQGR